jgi:hypothetical protein
MATWGVVGQITIEFPIRSLHSAINALRCKSISTRSTADIFSAVLMRLTTRGSMRCASGPYTRFQCNCSASGPVRFPRVFKRSKNFSKVGKALRLILPPALAMRLREASKLICRNAGVCKIEIGGATEPLRTCLLSKPQNNREITGDLG